MRKILIALVALLPLLAACGDDDSANASAASSSTTETSSPPSTLTGNVTVLAASSLTEAFGDIGKAFEEANPDTKVTFSFAASSALVEQANGGAPADVLVTADQSNFDKVTDVGAPRVIARNRIAILVESGNPKGIKSLDDLGRSDVVFVLCAPEVPCGKLGAEALEKAGVTAKPKSLEENVKGVVSKVTLGEADAGIVYVTDVKAADGKAEGVDIDIAGDPDLEAVYPMGVLGQSKNSVVAEAFIDFVGSPEGQALLSKRGFLAP